MTTDFIQRLQSKMYTEHGPVNTTDPLDLIGHNDPLKANTRAMGPEISFIPGKLYRYVYRQEWPVGTLEAAHGDTVGYDPLPVYRLMDYNNNNNESSDKLMLCNTFIKVGQVVMFVGWADNLISQTCFKKRLYFLVNDKVFYLPLWLFPTEINWIFEGPL